MKERFSHTVLLRNGTRDIFQVTMESNSKVEFILIVNHWPSRSMGLFETEAQRIIAAETLRYWIDRVIEIKGVDYPVVVMGDFNDEPFDKLIRDILAADSHLLRTKKRRPGGLLNLMWQFLGTHATYYYGSDARIFDQVMVSKGVLKNGKISIVEDSLKYKQWTQ